MNFFPTKVVAVLTEYKCLYINDYYFCRMMKNVLDGYKLVFLGKKNLN